jgi:hypothetical protein
MHQLSQQLASLSHHTPSDAGGVPRCGHCPGTRRSRVHPCRLHLGQLRLLDQHSLAYLLLNLVGSAVLAVIAFAEERWGFLLLEGVWSIVSAVSLVGVLAAARRVPATAER